jgi:CO/xanthine dehydrogenase FAD-binding subunit
MIYGATLLLASARGERTVPVLSFFRGDGLRNTVRRPDELLLGVTLPPPPPGLRAAYVKLRVRQAIDFPVLSVAVSVVEDEGRLVEDVTLVVGAVASQPRVIKGAADAARGRVLDAALASELGALAQAQCHFQPSLNVDSQWRRDVLPVFVRRALAAC